jgi:DNA-binding PadR family transcriptional regulator
MPTSAFLGEWEQLVLLCVLRLDESAYVLRLRDELGRVVGRRVARGALYRTLDRLEQKGYVRWALTDGSAERGGYPRRRFVVTRQGIAALKASRQALLDLWADVKADLR